MYPAKNFFLGDKWFSLSEIFGFLPLLAGSLWVTAIALVVSIPISVMTAVYIAEFAGPKMRKTLKITEYLHQRIKVFCVENKLKMNEWVENELRRIIDKNDNK
jgi:ABC-type uncharacterized transport system permease subunit